MAAEYDLIIIGASSAGMQAARRAAQRKARVALVEMGGGYGSFEEIYNRTLERAKAITAVTPSVWANAVMENLSAYSPALLAAMGVDIISGTGEFYSLPHLGFATEKRRLHAQSFLLALNPTYQPPTINGLDTVGCLTLRQIWQQDKLDSLPKRLLIVGTGLESLAFAQNLQGLGKEVIYTTPTRRLLPSEDPDAAFLIQAQLEAEGMRILPNSHLIQVKKIQRQKWAQVGNQAVEVDEIIWAVPRCPDLEELNFTGVGLAGRRRLRLNAKLQTDNPHIYGCGIVAGGYSLSHLATYEAEVAVHNALSFWKQRINYGSIPWVLFTQPQIGRVGMTETQARHRYGKRIQVLCQNWQENAQGQISGQLTGFCKLIVHPRGKLLGAHLVGMNAGELIGQLALAIQQELSVQALAQGHPPFSTGARIITDTAGSVNL
jgi:pyruvate/2-oxoglutarate dehydrogenase complex dihydrolipoamide dehydrogenase (E3) component